MRMVPERGNASGQGRDALLWAGGRGVARWSLLEGGPVVRQSSRASMASAAIGLSTVAGGGDRHRAPVGSTGASAEADSPRYFVQSLARGLDIVRAFGPDGMSLTLGEIARRTGMSRAAARRYVLTLRDLGYIDARGPRFELKPRLLELGYSYLSSLPLWKVAEPVLTRLVETLHESCSVSVLDLPDIVYVSRVAVKRIIAPNVSIGTRLPAFATTMGRIMLAALPPEELERFLAEADLTPVTRYTTSDPNELRQLIRKAGEQGYALIDQEFELGLRSLGVPILDRNGQTIAALNVSTQATRADVRSLVRNYLDPLVQASRNITDNLPY